MKFVCLSDIHAKYQTPIGRRDDIGTAFEKKITFIFEYAKAHGAYILQAGDLNDKPRNLEVLDFFIHALKKYQLKIFCVFGQHDLYMRRSPQESPGVLSVLQSTGLVETLGNRPFTIENDCQIYGANWGDLIPAPNKTKHNILVLHAPIAKKPEFPGHENTSPEYFMKENPHFNLVLVGDVHKKIFYKVGNNLKDQS